MRRLLCGLIMLAACSAEVHQQATPTVKLGLGPTTATATPGQDFIDRAGRKWISKGRVQLSQPNPTPGVLHQRPQASKPVGDMTRDELAVAVRPRALLVDHEYVLEGPDYIQADKIISTRGQIAPKTEGGSPKPGLRPQMIFGTDDRVQVGDALHHQARMQNGCSMTLVGRSAGLTAAHCFYENGQWISNTYVAFGANNWGIVSTPFGYTSISAVYLPWLWDGNSATSLDWDFALVEFAPYSFPGDYTGWIGTTQNSSSWQYIVGYPGDKPYMSQWVSAGYYESTWSARYLHHIDTWWGNSGACGYITTPAHYCTGHFVAQVADDYQWLHNESRMWDYTTHWFFDSYGYSWP